MQVRSDEARRNLKALLNEVEYGGEHIVITRYNTPAVVMVPIDWYEQAKRRMAAQEQDAGSGK